MPLHIIRQDITRMQVDAIVNTTNEELVGYSGVDLAIHTLAGPELDRECATLPPLGLGEAVLTGAYKLPCKYIIHTSGPIWRGGGYGEREALRSCYLECLRLAEEAGCETVAFPLISSGVYQYPKDQVLSYATRIISDYLFEHEMTVFLCVYDRDSYEFSRSLFQDIQSFIDDEYVGEREEELCGLSAYSFLCKSRLSVEGYDSDEAWDDDILSDESDAEDDSEPDESSCEQGADVEGVIPPDRAYTSPDISDVFSFIHIPRESATEARDQKKRPPRAESTPPDSEAESTATAPSGVAKSKAAIPPAVEAERKPRHRARPDVGIPESASRPVMSCMVSSAPPATNGRTRPSMGELRDFVGEVDKPFAYKLFDLIDERGMSDVECYKKANVDKKTFSKIRCNADVYKPSKQTAVAFAIALELSLEQTQQLLASAGLALSRSFVFDKIILFFITRGIYDIFTINEALFEFDQVLLGSF